MRRPLRDPAVLRLVVPVAAAVALGLAVPGPAQARVALDDVPGAAPAAVALVAPASAPASAPATAPVGVVRQATAGAVVRTAKPLAGLVIAVDPGHQLGNSNPAFAKYLAQKRFNGRIWKNCNTTGTATDDGYPEATFTWKVSLRLKARLEALGATVPMTRSSNSWKKWGPCTWDRGRFGAKVGARLMVQVHADGAPASLRGFHVITPGLTRGWTDAPWRGTPIWKADLALAKAMRKGMIAAGVVPSTYISGAISIRTDQMAMNYARIPTITVENGNMRNPREARLMKSAAGQDFYAAAMLRGIRTYLRR